jgi:hypothetical protein
MRRGRQIMAQIHAHDPELPRDLLEGVRPAPLY